MATLALRGRAALGLVIGGVLGAAVVGAPPVAAAAAPTIAVTTLADSLADDGACSLREAIAAANTDTASGLQPGECAAGGSADTIVFALGGTILLSGPLPVMTAPVTIDGAGVITIDGNGHGGLLVIGDGASVTLQGLTIQKASLGYDGAIVDHGNLTLDRCVVAASTASFTGGALQVQDTGTATVTHSTFRANAAVNGGAIWVGPSASLMLTGSTLYGNSASNLGGAIYTAGGAVVIGNSTFTGNSAGARGGGLAAASPANVVIVNDTIVSNTAAVAGGGLSLGAGTSGVASNLIVTGNVAPTAADAEGMPSGSANLVGVPMASLLGTFGDHGGPTWTYPLLRTATAAIDRADDLMCDTAAIAGVDQRGVTRPMPCDIGAVELDKVAPATSTPRVSIRTGVPIVGTAVRVRVAWVAADNAGGSGLDHASVQVSVNGGGYVTKAASLARSPAEFATSAGNTYRWRVRTVDHDGNASAWMYGPAYTETLLQQSSTAIRYSAGWRTTLDASASGGSTKYASAAGAWASTTIWGRAVAVVSPKGPGRGAVKVYVDGQYQGTLDLTAPVKSPRVVVWQRTWSVAGTHTVRLVVVGTRGRPRVDLDAVVRLR